MHGQVAGLRDIEEGNFLRGGLAYGPGYGCAAYFRAQGLAPSGCELFGIVEKARIEIVGQDDGGRENRAGQAAATGFVEARLKGVTGMGGKEHSRKIKAGSEENRKFGGIPHSPTGETNGA